MKKTATLISAMLLATGTAAVAAETETGATEGTEKEKRVCKSEKITGSLTRVRRVCMTQREWDELAENTRRNVDGLGRDAARTQTGQQ